MKRLPAILTSFSTFASAQEKITFDEHVFPIFQQSCLNCHNPDKAKGGLDLSNFSGTLKGSSGGKIVEPGDPGSSLMACVLQTAEPKMPPEGEKLAAAQIEILKCWIDGGLLENKSSSARKPTKPKFETALRSDPAAKPEGPPPMPEQLLLEPPVVTTRAGAIHAIASSPWAPLLAITSQRQVLLHHTETLELIGILPFPEGDPVSLNFTPDARYLIVGGGTPGKSGVTVTFDVTTGSRQLTVAKEFDTVLASDIRPDFDLVATGGPSRLLKVWDTETGSPLHSIKKHTDWITALDFSPDGVLLASGDRNGGVWVWESQSCNEFHTLRAHQTAITATVFRADSNILATASEDGTVRFWEMNGGSEVKKIDAHPGGVSAFAFGRDGSFVTAGRDLKAKWWKPDFNHARDLSQKLPSLPTAVALDAESKRAFIADAEGTVHVFETATGKHLAEIQANPSTIESRLVTLRERVSASEKTTTITDAEQSELTTLKKSLKHWSAAAINTRVLTTRREADENADATHEHQDHFTQAAEAITTQTLVLNQKRIEYGQLASRSTTPLSDEARAELQATLAAVQIRIAVELEALMSGEKELLTLHQSIDQSAPLTQQKQEDLQALLAAYREALK
jgi:hypothetical protein